MMRLEVLDVSKGFPLEVGDKVALTQNGSALEILVMETVSEIRFPMNPEIRFQTGDDEGESEISLNGVFRDGAGRLQEFTLLLG